MSRVNFCNFFYRAPQRLSSKASIVLARTEKIPHRIRGQGFERQNSAILGTRAPLRVFTPIETYAGTHTHTHTRKVCILCTSANEDPGQTPECPGPNGGGHTRPRRSHKRPSDRRRRGSKRGRGGGGRMIGALSFYRACECEC